MVMEKESELTIMGNLKCVQYISEHFLMDGIIKC